MTTGTIKFAGNVIGTITNANISIGNEVTGQQCYSTENGEILYDLFSISGTATLENSIPELPPSDDLLLLIDLELNDPNVKGGVFITSYDGIQITLQGNVHYYE